MMETKLETVCGTSTRPPAASARSPTSSTTSDRGTERNILEHLAEANPRARRRGARAAVRLRRPAQARRPHDPARAQGGRLEGSRARAARRERRGQGAASSANMSQRAAEMLREEMEFMPPQRRRVGRGGAVEDRRGRAPARGRGRDRASRAATQPSDDDELGRMTRQAVRLRAARGGRRPRGRGRDVATRAPPRSSREAEAARQRSRRRPRERARDGHAAGLRRGRARRCRCARPLDRGRRPSSAARADVRRRGRAARGRAGGRRSPRRSSAPRSSSTRRSSCDVVAGALRRVVDARPARRSSVQPGRRRPRPAPRSTPARTRRADRRAPPSAASRRGGCIVRTSEGEIDARARRAARAAAELLREALAAERRG